jgi:putative hydrolase of the HAD superfamily
MALKTMFFDVGGTLETFGCTPEYRIKNTHFFRELLSENGINLQLNDENLYEVISSGIKTYRKWSIESMIELKTGEIWCDYVFKDMKIDRDVLSRISETLSCYYEIYYYYRAMRPEVPFILSEIRKMKLKIGCISNTKSLTQVPETLKKYGIEDYFDTVVLSSVYGRRKPDPAIFYHAARLANSPTSLCGYVGDKINRDVLGARKASFRLAVQVRHDFDDGEIDEGATPDAIIDDLRELLPLLESVMKEDAARANIAQPHKIKAIFFDAGDILYYRPERDKHLNDFLSRHETHPVTNFESERKRIKDLAFSGQMKRYDYYHQLIRLYGINDALSVEEGVRALRRDDNSVAIFDGVPETVTALKQKGYLLGIITDTAMPFSRKLNWFEEHGFGRVWDLVISSKEIGVRKPAPSMYEQALMQAGLNADETVFVGHKTRELEGARALGMRTIAFNYDPDAKADAYIEDFRELLDLPLLIGS